MISCSCPCFRMDSSSALRIAVRVPCYYEACDDGRNVAHNAADFQLIVDRDTLNLIDLSKDVAAKVSIGKNQGFNLTYFDKNTQCYTNLTSDAALIDATNNYWHLRRLPLFMNFYDMIPIAYSQSVSLDNEASASVALPLLPPLLGHDDGQNNQIVETVGPGGGEADVESLSGGESDDDSVHSSNSDDSAEKSTPAQGRSKKKHADDDVSWEEDVEEYVGVNDEGHYMPKQQDQQASEGDTDSDSLVHDDLYVDDDAGCEINEHVTNLENPTIECGVTFEDGDTFKRAIRQYAVLKEFEIAAPYSESKRYRGHYKGFKSKKKRCKWRIHASQLQDGKTWQVSLFLFQISLHFGSYFSQHVFDALPSFYLSDKEVGKTYLCQHIPTGEELHGYQCLGEGQGHYHPEG